MFSIIHPHTFNITFFLQQSFWRDEAFTYLMISRSFVDILKLTANDFNPPLYYFLIKIYSTIFGTSEVALRSFSIICTLALIMIVGRYVKQKTHAFGSMILSMFIVVSMQNIYYHAFEARMYAQFAFLTGCLLFLEKHILKRYLVLICTCLLLTHYYSVFLLATFLLYSLKTRETENVKKLLIATLLASPWYLYALPKVLINSQSFWIAPSNWSQLTYLLTLVWGAYEPIWQYLDNWTAPLSAILIGITLLIHPSFSDLRDNFRSKWEYWLLFALLPLMFLISFFKPLIVARYLIFIAIAWIKIIIDKIFVSKYNYRVITVLIFMMIANALFLASALEFKHKTNWIDLSKEIKSQLKNNDRIFTYQAGEYFTLCYYFDCKNVAILEEKTNVPHFIGTALIPDSAYIRNATGLSGFLISENGSYQPINP